MGSLCCTKPSPSEKNYQPKVFSTFTITNPNFVRNHSSFDEIYSLDKQKLGYGSYGDVKLCIDNQFFTKKAVKIINKDYLRSSNIDNSWFYNKIDVINKLDHPYIIRFHEYFEERDFFYLIMDYHQEGDLLKRLKARQKLSESTICNIIKQLLIAVSYMHNHKIAHRDLKPENMMVTINPEVSVKLIDFDTSTSFRFSPLTGTMGTYHYMAPETVNKSYDEKCDVWSCGIIMYILLTGKSNLPGLTDNQIPKKLQVLDLDFNAPVWQKVSILAKELVKKLLQKDSKKRLSAMEALNHPWFSLISENHYDLTLEVLSRILDCKKNPLATAAKKFILYIKDSLEDFQIPEKAFIYLDKDNDGQLSFPDFLSFYLKKFDQAEAENLAKRLMEEIPHVDEYRILYSEFLEAAINEKALMEPENLRMFFRILCEKGSETLDTQKIAKTIGGLRLQRKEIQIWSTFFQQSKCEELNFSDFSSLVLEGISN